MNRRLVLILTISFISNGDKLSIHFPKLGEIYSKKVKVIAQIQLVLLDNQLLKNYRTLGIKKINFKENYSIIISSKVNISTTRFFLKCIYTLPCKVTINSFLRLFQCKILNNILYLNKKLDTFSLSNTQLCSFRQNESRGNKSPILLLQSYTRYLESSSGLFRCLYTFFTANTPDCHFWVS